MYLHHMAQGFFVRLLLPISLVLMGSQMWAQCDGARYRYRIFEEIIVDTDVLYGANLGASGANEELRMDIYRPANDGEEERPLVILAHGGFFLAGSKDGTDVVPLCEDLARMGYVAVSISYRLGIDNFFDLETSLLEAVLRGVHDAKAAIRFFRESHTLDGNPWGIDPQRVVLGGSSAGAFIALHSAYIDDLAEVPDVIDLTQPGLQGGLEGESGHPGYPSDVLSIINISGALGDADWMEPGDAGIVSTHGTQDNVVPFGTGMVQLLGLNVTQVDGSWPIHIQAEEVGVPHAFTALEGEGHVPHMTDAQAYDVTRAAVMSFTSQQVCPQYPSIPAYYDVDAPPAVGCSGDLSLDGTVAVEDLLLLLADFGCGSFCSSDLDADGAVTVTDVLVLLGVFGTPCG